MSFLSRLFGAKYTDEQLVAHATKAISTDPLIGGGTLASGLNDLIVGGLIIGLSIAPGKIKNTYGNWNPLVV